MTPKEILAQKPEVIVVDQYGGATFTVQELSPTIVEMMKSTPDDLDEFCGRFVLQEKDGDQ